MMNWLTRIWNLLAGPKHSALRQPEYPHLFWLLNSAWLCQAAYVVARLDIAERLRNGPLTAGELAKQCGAQETPLLQVMRALAGYGVFSQDQAGRFAINDQARPLLHDAEFSIHSYALVWGEQLYAACGQMLEQVKTGTTGFSLTFGQPIWDFYRGHPREANTFDTFMSAATDLHVQSITSNYRFTAFRRVADIGAGRGSLLSAVLHSSPHLQGIWYDRPEVLPEATARIQREGLADRCQLVAGSFLEEVPAGADLYLIKHVLHDWEDDMATRIVGNIARAMGQDSTLIIIEAVMDDRDRADGLCKLRDLEQMFWTGGRVRTRADFDRILRPAGLAITKITSTAIVDVRLIEVRRRD
jgi:hypothetical protein